MANYLDGLGEETGKETLETTGQWQHLHLTIYTFVDLYIYTMYHNVFHCIPMYLYIVYFEFANLEIHCIVLRYFCDIKTLVHCDIYLVLGTEGPMYFEPDDEL